MAATSPLSTLVLLSERHELFDKERVRVLRDHKRTARTAKTSNLEASKASNAADEAYLKEGDRILNLRRVVVHSVQEINVLIGLLRRCAQPYKLHRVIVNGPVPEDDAEEMMTEEVAKMRQALEERNFIHVKGNAYGLPNAEVKREMEN